MLGRRAATALEKRLGHRFRLPELLQLALTHRSRANEEGNDQHYERLEFLGDAVLGLVAAEWLYHLHGELPEGELSKRKAQLVSRPTLAAHARAIDLGEALRLGVGEDRSGGRTKASLLADSMEAVLGAVFLDGGLAAASKVIVPMLEARSGGLAAGVAPFAGSDAKTALQEEAQARAWPLPEYRVVASAGPDHEKVFTVECWLAGRPAASGKGSSKKLAEQRAASEALARLRGLAPPDEP